MNRFVIWLRNIVTTPAAIVQYIRARTVVFTLSKLGRSNTKRSEKDQLKNVYTRCHQISLATFIQCLIHSNYTGLVARGNPPERQRAQAWDLLYMEYCDLSNATSQKRILAIGREVGMLESKLLTVRTAVLVLSIRYSQRMADLLHRNGYRYDLDPKSGQKYIDELSSIVKKSKVISIAIKQKRFEYDEMMAKFKNEKVTEQYFEELLVELSRFMAFRLNANELTVTEFVAIQNRFDRECKRMERESDKIKAKTRYR